MTDIFPTFIRRGEEAVAHYGTKGMKWGVRKEAKLNVHNRVASGQASWADKAAALNDTNIVDLVKNKGHMKKISAGKAAILQGQKERLESGQGTKLDKYDNFMHYSLSDLRKKK